MLDAGWCPNEVLMLENLLLSPSMLYITSRFNRLNLDHLSYSKKLCLANQVDEENYKMQHVEVGCMCRHIEVDDHEVTSILKNEQTPLAAISIEGVHNEI